MAAHRLSRKMVRTQSHPNLLIFRTISWAPSCTTILLYPHPLNLPACPNTLPVKGNVLVNTMFLVRYSHQRVLWGSNFSQSKLLCRRADTLLYIYIYRITCERSESARERRIALYKSNHQINKTKKSKNKKYIYIMGLISQEKIFLTLRHM